jgi:hypothetical protein
MASLLKQRWPREADYDLFIVTDLTLKKESRDVHNYGNPCLCYFCFIQRRHLIASYTFLPNVDNFSASLEDVRTAHLEAGRRLPVQHVAVVVDTQLFSQHFHVCNMQK